MEDRIFECKKELEVSKWDNDNDCFSDERMIIEKGSVWKCSGHGYICGGEVRLINDDGKWLELAKETLDEYFADITEGNNEYLRSEYWMLDR